MSGYTHGGDILTAQSQYGGTVLDFSANLNPLGMPEAVRRAAAEAVLRSDCYPDPYCRQLAACIAARDGVARDWVICGNGAADIIFRLAFAERPRRALLTAPTFSEYGEALAAVGCEVVRHTLSPEQGFDLTEAILPYITDQVDMLFLCTPNNPTGRLIPPELLEQVLVCCGKYAVRLVLDECFLALTSGGGLAGHLSTHPNLFLLRAFTKSYAMAGLRLGYGLTSDAALLGRMARSAQPWSVSTVAQAAGLAALNCPEWPEKARALVATERPILAAGLAKLGFTVYPGQANYLLFRAVGVYDLKERLIEQGVLIRSCANYPGLERDYYRVCVRSREENGRLLAALGEVL